MAKLLLSMQLRSKKAAPAAKAGVVISGKWWVVGFRADPVVQRLQILPVLHAEIAVALIAQRAVRPGLKGEIEKTEADARAAPPEGPIMSRVLGDALHHCDLILNDILPDGVKEQPEHQDQHAGNDQHVDADELDANLSDQTSPTSR